MVGLLSRNNNSTRYAANLQTAQTPDPVITRHDDGTGTIVYGCNEAGVIDAVLVSSGKDLDQRAQDSKAQVDAGDLAERRARDVREFTSKMITVSSMPNATVNSGAFRKNGAATPHYG